MKINKEYIRSGVFGLEDSLVSTTGVVIGISTGTSNKEFIILATFVTIAVEAVSMAAGQFLSERTLHQLDKKGHRDNLSVGATVMLLSYSLGGLIPILPVLFFSLPYALFYVALVAFFALFILGYIKGKFVKVSPTRSAFEMLIIGGAAAVIGIVAGLFLKI